MTKNPQLRPVTPLLLAERFGPQSTVAKETISAIYAATTQNPPTLTTEISSTIASKPAVAKLGRLVGATDTPVDINRVIAAVQIYYLGLAQAIECQILAAANVTTVDLPVVKLPPPIVDLLSGLENPLRDLDWQRSDHDCTATDLLKPLYHKLLPRELRHALGEYYTPDWLATHLLDVASCHGTDQQRILDPACGSGTFLIHGIARVRAAAVRDGCSPREIWERVVQKVVGVDLHPLAIAAARVNYLFATRDLLPAVKEPLRLPLFHGDSILLKAANSDQPLAEQLGTFDLIVGNPPWVGWESLTEDYRRQTLPLWLEQGLFPHGGMATILGGGKKDLSLLMSYVVSDCLLKPQGRLAFVITQAAFKTASAGQGFRRFRCGRDETPLRVDRIDDFSAWQPFPGATTRAVTFVWQKGQETNYPVEYYQWQKPPAKLFTQRLTSAELLAQLPRTRCLAEPMDTADRTSPWLTAEASAMAGVRRWAGRSDYRAHEGANSGGANAVFWLEVLESRGELALVRNIIAGAKRQVPQVTVEIESALLYPLLRGKDVRRWRAIPSAHILLTQDPQLRRGIDLSRMEQDFPLTLAYLRQFEPMLRQRAAYRRYFTHTQGTDVQDRAPFYSMFDVGTYTLAPIKVVWHRMLTPLGAAVVTTSAGLPIIPQETHAFIPCAELAEAHYLAAVLNSQPFNFAAKSYSPAGSKGFGSPHLLEHLRIPRFDAANATHVLLATIGAECNQPETQTRLDLVSQIEKAVVTL